MNWFLEKFLHSGVAQAQAKKIIAKAGVWASGAAIAFIYKMLQKHGFTVSGDMATDVTEIGGGVAALVVLALTVVWDAIQDPKKVGIALQASAQAGEVVPTSLSQALAAGQTVTLPSGKTLTLGKPSPAGTTADDLNKAELGGNG